MRSHATRRGAPHWIFWPALVACAALVLFGLEAWTWHRWPAGWPGPVEGAPSGVGLTSAPAIVFVASLAACVFAIARWERALEHRHEPIALVALGLLGLGQLLIVQAALAGARAGAPFPGLAAIDQARWILVGAASLGALALLRIARSRPRKRGALFAIAALIGAPSTLPVLGLLDAEPSEARIAAELELASSPHASIGFLDPLADPSPVLDVLANGELRLARSLDGTPQRFDDARALRDTLQRFAEELPQLHGAPDAHLILRVDRGAEYRHASEALRIASEVRLWQVSVAILRSGHGIHGRIMLFLPLPADAGSTPEPDAPRTLRLAEQAGEPRFEWDGEWIDLDAAVDRARGLTETLRLVPDGNVPWEWIVQALPELTDPAGVQAFATAFELEPRR